jgi:hypothetical protein
MPGLSSFFQAHDGCTMAGELGDTPDTINPSSKDTWQGDSPKAVKRLNREPLPTLPAFGGVVGALKAFQIGIAHPFPMW